MLNVLPNATDAVACSTYVAYRPTIAKLLPTHRDNHTLDLVITANDSSLSPVIDYSPVSPSDHFPVFSTLTISPLPPSPSFYFSFHCLKSINISRFTTDVLSSRLITHPPNDQNLLHFSINMLHLKLKAFVLNLRILGSHQPYLN